MVNESQHSRLNMIIIIHNKDKNKCNDMWKKEMYIKEMESERGDK